MTAERSEAMQKWASLAEGLRHPKNLAVLAVEHLVLPTDHPCRVAVLQYMDSRAPAVSVLVELPGVSERTVEVLEGDDPAALAARIRAAADELVDGFDHGLWLAEHFLDEDQEPTVSRFDETTDRVRAERLRRIRETVRKEYSAGFGTVPSADQVVEVVREIEAELMATWYKPGRAPVRGEDR